MDQRAHAQLEQCIQRIFPCRSVPRAASFERDRRRNRQRQGTKDPAADVPHNDEPGPTLRLVRDKRTRTDWPENRPGGYRPAEKPGQPASARPKTTAQDSRGRGKCQKDDDARRRKFRTESKIRNIAPAGYRELFLPCIPGDLRRRIQQRSHAKPPRPAAGSRRRSPQSRCGDLRRRPEQKRKPGLRRSRPSQPQFTLRAGRADRRTGPREPEPG